MSSIDKTIAQSQMTLVAAAVIVGAYVLWKLYQSINQVGGAVGDAAGSAVVGLLGLDQTNIHTLASARLPNGTVVPFDDILRAGGRVDSNQNFTWQGVRYKLTGTSVGGVYMAEIG